MLDRSWNSGSNTGGAPGVGGSWRRSLGWRASFRTLDHGGRSSKCWHAIDGVQNIGESRGARNIRASRAGFKLLKRGGRVEIECLRPPIAAGSRGCGRGVERGV